MKYRLFLDDERDPIGNDWKIARDYYSALDIVRTNGMPSFISFDHDLGEELNGKDFANWLIERDMMGDIEFPDDFEFYVHSQNPIGAANIKGVFESYKKFKDG